MDGVRVSTIYQKQSAKPDPKRDSYTCYFKNGLPGHDNEALGEKHLCFTCSKCENWFCDVCYKNSQPDSENSIEAQLGERCPVCGVVESHEQMETYEWFPHKPKSKIRDQDMDLFEAMNKRLEPSGMVLLDKRKYDKMRKEVNSVKKELEETKRKYQKLANGIAELHNVTVV